jgi:NADH-quinone oxidoreductase subunit C
MSGDDKEQDRAQPETGPVEKADASDIPALEISGEKPQSSEAESGIADAPDKKPEFTIEPPVSGGSMPEAGVEVTPPAPEAQAAAGEQPAADPEREAKLKAAAEARAARAAAKAAAETEEAPAEPKAPSPNQPRLDAAAALIRTEVHEEAVDEAYINEMNADMPTLVIKAEHWSETAQLFKTHDSLQCNYLRNVSGVDQETHMEVVYHFISLTTKHDYAVKVKTDRDAPSVPSVTPVWATANWNEREIYDLLGIDFPGHPDLRRIMMPDDWAGHPLRKDYEPLDSEV